MDSVDAIHLMMWGLAVVVLLVAAAAVTYLVKSWGRRRDDRERLTDLERQLTDHD